MRVKCIKDTIGYTKGKIYETYSAGGNRIMEDGNMYSTVWRNWQEYFQEVIEESKIENPDFSSVIKLTEGIMKEVKEGTLHEENDYTQYIYEAVMEAIYGKDVWKLF